MREARFFLGTNIGPGCRRCHGNQNDVKVFLVTSSRQRYEILLYKRHHIEHSRSRIRRTSNMADLSTPSVFWERCRFCDFQSSNIHQEFLTSAMLAH